MRSSVCRRSVCIQTAIPCSRVLLPRGVWAIGFAARYLRRRAARRTSVVLSERYARFEEVANVKTMAHVTGGGLLENVPRTLPAERQSDFRTAALDRAADYAGTRAPRRPGDEERYRVFNMGIGYTLSFPLPMRRRRSPRCGCESCRLDRSRDADDEPTVVVHPARDDL